MKGMIDRTKNDRKEEERITSIPLDPPPLWPTRLASCERSSTRTLQTQGRSTSIGIIVWHRSRRWGGSHTVTLLFVVVVVVVVVVDVVCVCVCRTNTVGYHRSVNLPVVRLYQSSYHIGRNDAMVVRCTRNVRYSSHRPQGGNHWDLEQPQPQQNNHVLSKMDLVVLVVE